LIGHESFEPKRSSVIRVSWRDRSKLVMSFSRFTVIVLQVRGVSALLNGGLFCIPP